MVLFVSSPLIYTLWYVRSLLTDWLTDCGACSDLWRERAGPDDVRGLRLPLQMHHASSEQGRMPPAEERQRAGGGLLHGGDGELRI